MRASARIQGAGGSRFSAALLDGPATCSRIRHVRLSLDTFTTIPRVNGLLLSPDGSRLVLPVQMLSPDGTRFISSLWELPSDGSAPARRITYSDKGEASPAFLPDGSLVFASARPDPTVKPDEESEGRIWTLPAAGGEARPLASIPAGVDGLVAARDAGVVVVKSQEFEGVSGLEADAERAKQRKEAGVSALLFDGYPIRHWDHELGPRQPRLLRLEVGGDAAAPQPEDLTPDAGRALQEAEVAVAPDGRTLVTTWWRDAGAAFREIDLVELGPRGLRTLGTGADFAAPAVSPDGRFAVAVREERGTPERAVDLTLWLVDLATGEGRDLLPGFDLWPGPPVWAHDGREVYFVADELGHAPVFRVDVASGEVTRLTTEACFSSLCPEPGGDAVFALRSSYRSPAEVVRIGRDGSIRGLPTPGLPLDLPGTVEEVHGAADDGTELRAWLVLPKDASPEHPAPLALWVHGGPLSSWNAWSWRWCPYLLSERGYAVLLPDPALSTGYGHAFVQRSWGAWGERAYTDLMTITDAALCRDDLDASRTAAMGGSFGGYMANWIAGHTDRFRAIVSHAGLWSLEQFHGTTDMGPWWEHQLGNPYVDPSRYVANSPSSAIEHVRTPMLVIHGLRDYRVPVAEALRLWTDLQRHGVPAQYLSFPDENHWILKPGNSKVWYETVLAFLAHHVLGEEWKRPELL